MSSSPVPPRKAQGRLLLLKPALDSISGLIALAGVETESNSNMQSSLEDFSYIPTGVKTPVGM
jgi:hypothetical protein